MITIIPAIDIIDGKCVRLTKGDYDTKKIYNEDPLEVAKSFEDVGLTRLHLVDLDGAKSKEVINWRVLEKIANKTQLIIDFGGGLKRDQDLHIVFESGAQMVTIGSVAVKQPDQYALWLSEYGAQKIILGADVKDKKVAVSGWTETSNDELIPFLKDKISTGTSRVICTDISKDGMLQGSAIELYTEIMIELPEIHLIASGGVDSIADLNKLENIGCRGAIIGKAIYEGKLSLQLLEQYNHAR